MDHDPANSPPTSTHDSVLPALLERRLTAAAYDTGLMSACCVGLFLSLNPLSQVRHLWIALPFALVLAILLGIEALTGRPVGKAIQRLRLQRVGAGRIPLASLVVRTI